MGTTKSRKSRRNNSRPAAFTFLSNISLGNEIHSTDIHNPPLVSPASLESHNEGLRSEFHENTSTTQQQSMRTVERGSLISSDSNVSTELPGPTPLCSTEAGVNVPPLASSQSVMTTSLLSEQIQLQQQQQQQQRRRWSLESDDNSVQHHKLTREDSERPIASEKIKKKSHHTDKENYNGGSIMSVVRYYTEKIRFSTGKRKAADPSVNRGYLQQQLASHDNNKRRPALSYAHFLIPSHSLEEDQPTITLEGSSDYDPSFLDNDSYNRFGILSSSQGSNYAGVKPSEMKRELNEQFRHTHPEIPVEITLSKIRSIKTHLLEIGKEVDLEISSVAHAFVYFEKLVIKNVVTKKNRKLIAACCLFLATKVNEAKGSWFEPLFDAIDNELDVDSEEIREHEFAVFADLEFNLYIKSSEFMPHFERIFQVLEYKSIEDYLGGTSFYNG
ncbi:cyclin-like protein [Phascolomyces articulosus]|uniref:Cyclin-like protein n=1 Tax=Phascolomyces articulosus TaxID=60185 RepID=A0AAD5P807_9FUNG|nr:cyclin-like protein [Phascolomyces articulosus]